MNKSQKNMRSGSYLNAPVVKTADGLYGRSHAWGDVSPDVRNKVIGKIISSSRRDGLDAHDTAYILAFVYYPESGFNPSAAVKTSSGVGLGQFTNATRDTYKLSDENMWDAQSQIDGINKLYVDAKNKAIAHAKAQNNGELTGNWEGYIYAYHHDGLYERNIDHNSHKGIEISRAQVVPGVPAWEEVVRRWGDGINVADIEQSAVPGRSGKFPKISFTINVTDPSAGPGAGFAVNSDGTKVTVSRGGVTTFKDVKTGAMTANIPGLGDGLKVDPTGLIHAGDLCVRLPLTSTDDMGGVYANGHKLADIPYGSSLATNGLGVIVLDGKNSSAPSHMVLPDGSVAQFDNDADGKPSGVSMTGQGDNPRYAVALQKTPHGGFSVVTTDNQTHATTSDAYGADSRLISSKTQNADGSHRDYTYDQQSNITAETDYDGERTTSNIYKLAGANVNTLSEVAVANPDGTHVVTTYKIDPNSAASDPETETYTNTDGSTSTTTFNSNGVAHKVVAKDSNGRMITTAVHQPDGSVKVITGGRHSGGHVRRHGANHAELEENGIPGDPQDQTAASDEGQGGDATGGLSFNSDGSGSATATNPDGTTTTATFDSLTGAAKLADIFGTLPEVTAAYPDRFALRYMSMANQHAAQLQNQSPQAGDEHVGVGAPDADASSDSSSYGLSPAAVNAADVEGQDAPNATEGSPDPGSTQAEENQDAGGQERVAPQPDEAMA